MSDGDNITLDDVKNYLARLGYTRTRLLHGNILAIEGNKEFEYRIALSENREEMEWKIQLAHHELLEAEREYQKKYYKK